jgi:hypothetical protein
MIADDSGSKEVIQPLTVRVGNRTLTIDSSPLPLREKGRGELALREGFPPVVQADIHSVVVGLSAPRYACHFLFVPLGVVATVSFGTAAAFPNLRPWLIPLVGSTLPTWSLVLLAALSLLWLLLFRLSTHLRILCGASRVRFDRGTGLMTFGPVWSRQSRPGTPAPCPSRKRHLDPRNRVSSIVRRLRAVARTIAGRTDVYSGERGWRSSLSSVHAALR